MEMYDEVEKMCNSVTFKYIETHISFQVGLTNILLLFAINIAAYCLMNLSKTSIILGWHAIKQSQAIINERSYLVGMNMQLYDAMYSLKLSNTINMPLQWEHNFPRFFYKKSCVRM